MKLTSQNTFTNTNRLETLLKLGKIILALEKVTEGIINSVIQ